MIELTDLTATQLIEDNDIVVLDFYADWCGPCKTLSPILNTLSEKYEGKVSFGKINIETNNQLVTQHDIRNIPTLLYIKNGEVTNKTLGALPENKIVEIIETLINT